jgi:endonuclease/exonuclease/phosphatase (EEP) superfamily protein YafD
LSLELYHLAILKASKLVDLRRGRGTFNTFNAKIPIFRWPLDHVFLSKELGLISIKVHDSIDSDSFPFRMVARSTAQKTTKTKKANVSEKKEARDKIDHGLNNKN